MLVNIQFLRFVAAALVMFYHCAALVNAASADSLLFTAVESFGFAGVDIFFVISGFIMFHTTGDSQGISDSSRFLRRRIARIYSGYWPFLLLALVVLAWTNPDRLGLVDIPGSIALWPVPGLVLPVSWTLVYEMYFYVCFAGLLLVSPSVRLRALLGVAVLVLAWVSWAQFGRQAYSEENLLSLSVYEYYFAGPYLLEFVTGALAGYWLSSGRASPGGWVLATGVIAFCLGGWINNHLFDTRIEQGYTMYYRVLLFGPASVLILAGLVGLEQRGVLAPRRFSLLTGGASYAIYLSHTLAISIAVKLGMITFLQQRSAPEVVAWVSLFAGLTLVLSVLYYQYVERWLHRQFRKVLRV